MEHQHGLRVFVLGHQHGRRDALYSKIQTWHRGFSGQTSISSLLWELESERVFEKLQTVSESY